MLSHPKYVLHWVHMPLSSRWWIFKAQRGHKYCTCYTPSQTVTAILPCQGYTTSGRYMYHPFKYLKSLHLAETHTHSNYTFHMIITINIDYFPKKFKGLVGRAKAQAVSRWLPTVAARFRTRVWSCGICGGQSGAGSGFLLVLRFPLPIFIPPIAPQSPSSNHLGLVH
jgi:hypothetical protein